MKGDLDIYTSIKRMNDDFFGFKNVKEKRYQTQMADQR